MSDVAFGSDMESDSGRSSVDVPCGTSDGGASGSSKADGDEGEQLTMRCESLQQENRVLRMELETVRYRCKGLEQENKDLKRARVNIVSSFVIIQPVLFCPINLTLAIAIIIMLILLPTLIRLF